MDRATRVMLVLVGAFIVLGGVSFADSPLFNSVNTVSTTQIVTASTTTTPTATVTTTETDLIVTQPYIVSTTEISTASTTTVTTTTVTTIFSQNPPIICTGPATPPGCPP